MGSASTVEVVPKIRSRAAASPSSLPAGARVQDSDPHYFLAVFPDQNVIKHFNCLSGLLRFSETDIEDILTAHYHVI